MPELESLPQKAAASPSINLLNWPPMARTSFSSEDPEIEKQKDISVFAPVKRDHTLLPASEPKAENSKELEEEDDHNFYLTLRISFEKRRLFINRKLLISRSRRNGSGLFGRRIYD